MIDELKLGAQLETEPKNLEEKTTKDWMREKNDELIDTLVKQERMCEKYKWELKKTGEALDSEAAKVDGLRKENLKLREYIKKNVKVPSAADLDEQRQTLRQALLQQIGESDISKATTVDISTVGDVTSPNK